MRAIALALASIATCALAQTAPPIKPGLWEIVSQREVDGKTAGDTSEELRKMPPEARKQFDETMRQKGVDVGGAGQHVKVCMSREVLEQGPWQARQSGCKTEFTSRTSASWKWRTQCDSPQRSGEGEAVFVSPEAYAVKSTMKATVDGHTRTTRTTVNGKWLGADCGSLPPMKVPRGG